MRADQQPFAGARTVETGRQQAVHRAGRIHAHGHAGAAHPLADQIGRALVLGREEQAGQPIRVGADRRQRVDHGLRPFAEGAGLVLRHDLTRSSMRNAMMRATCEIAMANSAAGSRSTRAVERLEDRCLVGALDREDEGKAELGAVGVIQLGEAAELLGCEPVETGAGLLAARVLGNLAGDRRPAGEVGMGTQQRQLLIRRGLAHLIAESRRSSLPGWQTAAPPPHVRPPRASARRRRRRQRRRRGISMALTASSVTGKSTMRLSSGWRGTRQASGVPPR